MMNKEKNFASAVIYVHNAENRIENFLNMIIKTMEDNFEHSEIICVNDASEDRSLNIIKETSISCEYELFSWIGTCNECGGGSFNR